MKKAFLPFLLSLFCIPAAFSQLIITGVVDGPLPGGTPKAIELFATAPIADLSVFGLGSANNGGGTDGEEFTFPGGSASMGDFIYIAQEAVEFQNFFGFAPGYTDGSASINGDDAIELFMNGSVIDIFGDINVDGNGEAWEYLDGWAYRVDGTGPDGTTFVLGNWTYSGPNALDGESSNSTAVTPFPIGTYMQTVAMNEFNFNVATTSVGEGDALVSVSVGITPAQTCDVDVSVDASSTATMGSDYTLSGVTTLNFLNGGAPSMNVDIAITDDGMVEGPETIVLNLSNSTNGCNIGSNDQVIITINDNDFPSLTIGSVTTEDAQGVADDIGTTGEITGVVHCINFREGVGLDFFVRDATGGIVVFLLNGDLGYPNVTEGDELTIVGTIGQFRGLTQIAPMSITVNSSGNALTPPTVVSILDESTESLPVTLQNYELVDAAQWTTGMGGFGFYVDAYQGTDTVSILIDSDTDLYNMAAPMWPFNVTGMGAQRSDNTMAPLLDGYHLRVCGSAHLVELVPMVPIVSFSPASSSVNEGIGTVMVDVTMVNPDMASPTTVDVQLDMPGTTATMGADFTFTPVTLTFPAGSAATQQVSVAIIDDTMIEGAETVALTLVNPSNAAVIGTATHTITITDNDVGTNPVVSFDMASSSFDEDAGTITVDATITNEDPSNATSVDVSVFGTSTAMDPSDFSLVTTTLTFPAGSSANQSVSINIFDDTVSEPNETIVLSLSNPSMGASVGTPGQHVVTLFDNDAIGVHDVFISENIEYYPNPVTDALFIESRISLDRLVLSNTLGQAIRVIETPSNVYELDLAELNAGIYFLTLSADGEFGTIRIVKEN